MQIADDRGWTNGIMRLRSLNEAIAEGWALVEDIAAPATPQALRQALSVAIIVGQLEEYRSDLCRRGFVSGTR